MAKQPMREVLPDGRVICATKHGYTIWPDEKSEKAGDGFSCKVEDAASVDPFTNLQRAKMWLQNQSEQP